jgi:hypothetical protein
LKKFLAILLRREAEKRHGFAAACSGLKMTED